MVKPHSQTLADEIIRNFEEREILKKGPVRKRVQKKDETTKKKNRIIKYEGLFPWLKVENGTNYTVHTALSIVSQDRLLAFHTNKILNLFMSPLRMLRKII